MKGYLPYFSPEDLRFAWANNVQQMRVAGWLNDKPYLCVADRGDSNRWVTIYPAVDAEKILYKVLDKEGIDKGWIKLFTEWKINYHCEYPAS